MSQAVHMIMLGPSRVGKSTLLAIMSREITRLPVGFDLIPMDDTQDRLEEAYDNLYQVTNQPVFAPAVVDLLGGTQDFIQYEFAVNFQQRKEFDLIFHDFRGGAMMQSGSDLQRLREKIAQSRVIFNVLDAVSLMEVDSFQGDKRNCHTRTRHLLSQTLNRKEQYLILFALVRCETYMKTESRRQELIKRFEERHKAVLQLIESFNQTDKNIVGVLIPVITLGCVEFIKIDSNGSYVFERTHRDFQPRDVDQLLRYALAFALNQVDNNRWLIDSFWRWFTGLTPAFREALRAFSGERKTGYKTYGNPNLLGGC